MMRPSAPTATAAFVMAMTRLRLPVPCEGSMTIGRCESSRMAGNSGKIERVASVGFEGTDPALTQNDVRVATKQDIFCRLQPLLRFSPRDRA